MNWWKFVVASELRKILAFRSDFWVSFVGQTLVQVIIARALWENIFASTGKDVMEGFTLSTMTLYYIIAPVGMRALTGENIGFLSREIYDGSFNKYLIYPISFFQYKTLTYLTYSAFYLLQLIFIFILYNFFFGNGMNLEMLGNLLLGVGIFMLASFAYAMISMFIELISLWADNIWSLMVMARFFVFFLGGSFVPLAFFPDWAQEMLAITPFPYLVSLPIKTTMGIATASEILSGICALSLWTFIFALMAERLWKKGQLRYTGVGI